jgi:hypothetical protein
MTQELEEEIRIIYKQKAGSLKESLKPEFKNLCREDFNFSVDMSCGKCIYKHAVKLYDKYLK